MGGYSAGRCGWDDHPPAGDGSDNIPSFSGASDSPGVGVTGAFCHQCYLLGSACRCLESSSTASTASTTGPLWSDIADPTFGPNSAPAGRGAGSALPYGSSSMAGGSIWDLPSTDFPGLPGAPSAIRQPRPPAGRASHLESQLMAIRYGLTAPPEPLRLPQPTWMPPATQNCRRAQLPPPPPRTDSVSTTDQSQQTTAPDTGPEGQGTRRPGRARVRGHHHGPVSPPPRQPYTSLQASGHSGGTSRRAPDWNLLANLANHRSGDWKKTWTSTWEPTLGSITGRSRPPSGPH